MNTVCCLISPVLLFMNSALTYKGAENVASRSLHSAIVYFGSANSGSEKLKDIVPWKSSIGEISSKMSDRPEVVATLSSPASTAFCIRSCQRPLPTSQSKLSV
uniref:Putative ion transport n=1 Tax=Renibacterium salmoninarum TaxID=1646 RepID=Q8KHC7_RENSA|nr:putative ion transport [Renibacterium salmoninarum]AAM47186.1 putative ion transport protein [Renibacterium salmoninarum]AAM47189.1 putative ion transport protein [Renibacterium salmoninarum]